MLRGTRILEGKEAALYTNCIRIITDTLRANGFSEVIIPSIWEQSTFIEKAGAEIIDQMWSFKDKGDRDVCLIPEVTGIIQELWNESWSKEKPKPYKIFYVSRCYRYERPQEGRYREFLQIGVEILGSKDHSKDLEDITTALIFCLDILNVPYVFKDSIKRGLSYYIEDGFEVECESLGAQKQIAGGGRYKEGIGWAIGLDRLVLALQKKNQET